MNANSAMIINFSAALRKARRADATERVNIYNALEQIACCGSWLGAHQISILGFTASTLHEPVVFVAAHPKVYALFSDRDNPEQRQDGALRYEVWQGFDPINKVTVRWEEVSACA